MKIDNRKATAAIEADERLRSAAPELLAACKAFLNLYRECDMRPEDDCAELARIMQAAIARAEGGGRE